MNKRRALTFGMLAVAWLVMVIIGCVCTSANQRMNDRGSATTRPTTTAAVAPVQDVNQQAAGQVAVNADAQVTLTTYMPWAMVVLLTFWNLAREAGIAFDSWQDAKTERIRIQTFGGERRRA